MKQRLDLRQGQNLVMTPQMQQAIKLLQMSNLDLAAFIEAEIEKNPLLEKEERSEDTKTATEEGDGDEIDAVTASGSYDAFATNSFSSVGRGGNLAFDDPAHNLEGTLAALPSLTVHLEEQIHIAFTDVKDRAIALILTTALDESGYLRADINVLAQRLGCSSGKIETIIATLQGMDPPGIFARSLSECLSLQLRDRNRLDPAMATLLEHLDLVASHDTKKLMTLCTVDEDDLRDMIAEIRTLNPKPALKFEHFVSQTVVPDALMRPLPKSKGGGWAVELNTATLPRVLVNKSYYTEVLNSRTRKEDQAYITEQWNAAHWLVKAMDQRAQTILKVAGEIVIQQEAFFLYGVEYLKPMTLKDVAQAIGMHESTISRVTTQKYLGTPRGVFEMKYFFSSGIATKDGGMAISSESIRARIKHLIAAETAETVLSDDDIALRLKDEGIDVARRTVAKYREELKIPSSVQRRRRLR
jgi:RNA polymerase sigma-54 factor